MGMVLSIYSQKGFREVTLPERGQDELEVLIQKELFALDQDIRLKLEKREEHWRLELENAAVVAGKGPEGDSAVTIRDGFRFEAATQQGSRITVISFEQSNPFSVYKKYELSGLREVTIGRKPGNMLQYENDFVSGEHCSIVLENGTAKLCDKSTNGTYLNFKRVYGSTVLNYGDSIRVMRLNIIYLGNMIAVDECDHLSVSLSPLGAERIQALAGPVREEESSHKILFRRSPRELEKLYTDPFEIEGPPQPPDSREAPLAMTIGPALTMSIPMMLGTAVSVFASRSSGAGSGAMMYMGMITALASALIGAVWALINVRYAAKMKKQEENRRFERYSEYLIRMRDKIEKAHNENAAVLNKRYLSAGDCCALDEHSPLLWNRNSSHEDYLSVRLGIGEVPFQAPISVPRERFSLINDSLADKPQVILDNFKTLRQVPVTVDLMQNRLVGIAGGENRKAAISVAKAMMAQLATANCYTDVKIAVIYDGSKDIDREAWDFAMWLPHVWSSDKKIRYIATSKSEAGDVFHALTQVLRNRSEEEKERSWKPHFVLFVTEPRLLDSEAVARYVFARNENLGLSTVLLADRPEDLPNECECVVECDSEYQGLFSMRGGREDGTQLKFDTVTDEGLKKLSKTLGRIEVIESEQEGEIPNTLTFFDMFGIDRPEALNAAERWKKANSIQTMKALVGFRSGNAPCYLDIHERYHGPHGLVAGTTGSGKSETLQTYILSLAVNFSPEDIGFFIIDYKGGGMANLFDGLPHMIGSISNLSGNQVKRAMVSIQSENRRRQRIFTEYGVNNINGYTALYKSGDAVEPVPHLFIIIDEFAELKREEPEFMKELISVAQVGRSLGVHLILSTQRPSGTVDENIWANSKFRLCLRVQDRQDSMDMLHRTEAAYLTQAGRCYLQVGNDEIFELFQSGWSGASYDEELGGGSLLIAQMLSATGKVDLAGNHAKVKRKEELKRRWVHQLVDVLRTAQRETGLSVSDPSFSFEEHGEFKDSFYQALWKLQPDFEDNQFNNTRIGDFCALYRELADIQDDGQLVLQLIRKATREGKRLPEVKSKTQLEVTVDYLRGVAEEMGIEKIRKLWLPVLPTCLYLDSLEPFSRSAFDGKGWKERPRRFQLSAVIGMADDPANQAQLPVSLDFANGGHHMVIGTVSTGKSTLLQTVIYSLTSSYTPDLLNVYCLDFSAKMMSVFSDLKHVGGYLDENDLDGDGFSKFFTMMTRILDERKTLFAGTSYEDYVNYNGWTVPAILIVIDNYGSFHDKTGETYEANMMRIAKEGNSYGVYLLVSAGGIGMQELPGRLAETFRTGVALEMQDSFAYADVLRVVRPPVLPETKVKGRGLMYCGERILEFQTALATRAEDGPERTELLKKAVAAMNAAYTGPRARAIPAIPDNPTREDFTSLPEYRQLLERPELMPAGYDFEFADIYSLNLVENYVFLITGTKKSGKSVFMENLMLNSLDRGDEVVILEMGDSRFAQIAQEHALTRCTEAQEVYNFLSRIHGELVQRAGIKKACLDRKASQEEMFTAAQANSRINIFIGNMSTLIGQLHDPESPVFNARDLFETLCERGMGYNIFLYGEVSDREETDLMGYTCFDSMRGYRSGVRFGGRFSEQKLFPFENVGYQDQERSMKCGVGMVPSENREERQVKIVVPMS
ncbi:FHA domain-containing protein [Pseudoflavonifractor sp. 60]|nr:FHA domain-containing protein [Pseudoflavonifractor sp. 60]